MGVGRWVMHCGKENKWSVQFHNYTAMEGADALPVFGSRRRAD